MDNLNEILALLKDKGRRFSQTRWFILRALAKSHKPLSAADFQRLMKKNNLSADRTTLYRELKLLLKEAIILEMRLKDASRRYELALSGHHHHLVCVKCDKIKNVGCDHKIADKILEQSPDFARIQSHSYVFFGLCKLCERK